MALATRQSFSQLLQWLRTTPPSLIHWCKTAFGWFLFYAGFLFCARYLFCARFLSKLPRGPLAALYGKRSSLTTSVSVAERDEPAGMADKPSESWGCPPEADGDEVEPASSALTAVCTELDIAASIRRFEKFLAGSSAASGRLERTQVSAGVLVVVAAAVLPAAACGLISEYVDDLSTWCQDEEPLGVVCSTNVMVEVICRDP